MNISRPSCEAGKGLGRLPDRHVEDNNRVQNRHFIQVMYVNIHL